MSSGTTLIVRGLPKDVKENEVLLLFNRDTELAAEPTIATDVTLAKDPETGECVGYGFIEFASKDAAESALESAAQGLRLMGRSRFVELDWARAPVRTPIDQFQVYVGGLSEEVTESHLASFCKQFSKDVIGAKVILDAAGGKSRGYGFVRYRSEEAADAAVHEMLNFPEQLRLGPSKIVVKKVYRTPVDGDASKEHKEKLAALASANTTVYVANVAQGTTETKVKELFGPFGSILSVRIAFLKHIAFVTYAEHVAAVAALTHLNGCTVHGQKLHMAWGRQQHRAAPSQRVQSVLDHDQLDEARMYNIKWHNAMTPSTLIASGQDPNPAKKPRAGEGPGDDAAAFWLAQIAGAAPGSPSKLKEAYAFKPAGGGAAADEPQQPDAPPPEGGAAAEAAE